MILTDNETKTITIPRGDTGVFDISLTGDVPTGAIAVFAVCTSDLTRDILLKKFEISNNAITVSLNNADTRGMSPGEYLWDIRFITGADIDENGKIHVNDSTDTIDSLFAANGMPKFIVTGVAANV